ncbi:hypothetical protein CLUG_01892 [Clavispora lusitaniae ATCC 42720]|uniref:Uncharacterized protein n=1 Tax=Clavispora lusitaniae (strain ATCC 42720) TaxID=306902 RepID=C4Y110_CLAL4|nr:uncharacterized protein CLUG_01892 [Clavispora lusitaniae ATCC 42720]EEQ37770.1 hypothetical protein CLUG_01892 [Clavispora lusitaniae ATCC 42720]
MFVYIQLSYRSIMTLYIYPLNLFQKFLVGVVVVADLDGELISFLVVLDNLERRQVVNNNVGTSFSDLLRVVGRADTNNHGTSTFTSSNTSWGIFENHNLLQSVFVAQVVSGSSVAHWVGLTLGDFLGSDESVWLFNCQQLQPLGGQRQSARCDNSPSLLLVVSLFLGKLVELLHQLNGTRDRLGLIAKSVWNGSLPSSNLLFNGVFRRPLGNDIKGTAAVRCSDDFLWVHVRSGFTKVSPKLGNGSGGVDQSTVAVEKSSVNVENSRLFSDSHG